jgi:hypothetical protein
MQGLLYLALPVPFLLFHRQCILPANIIKWSERSLICDAIFETYASYIASEQCRLPSS